MLVLARFIFLIFIVSQIVVCAGKAVAQPRETAKLNLRPCSLALSHSEKTLLIANQNRGTFSLVDLTSAARDVQSSLALAKQPVCIRPAKSANHFLVSDFDRHVISLIQLDEQQLKVSEVDSLEVSRYPQRIAVNSQREKCAVACLWSRRIHFVNLHDDRLQDGGKIDLPFSPGPLAWLDDRQVLVADAFGEQMAVVDVNEKKVLKNWKRAGRRIGGFTVTSDNTVLLTDIKLNALAHSIQSDIHWGTMIANEFHGYPVSTFVDDTGRLTKAFLPQSLGGPGEGKGDPTAVIETTTQLHLIILQGVGEIAVGDRDSEGFSYLQVGIKPTDIVATQDARTAYVCNSLDDTISEIDLTEETVATIHLNSDLQTNLQLQGEQLFFDASLSLESWMSCHSCHVNGHTSGLLNDNLSDQSFGAAKRILSLLGHRQTLPLAWNGSMPTMAEQVSSSIKTTMRGRRAEAETVAALVAFVESLPAPPSLAEARQTQNDEAIAMGRQVFEQADCQRCHGGDGFTSPATFDVGLTDQMDNSQFNPPSLIGVSQRNRFFHDGRAETLRQVLVDHAHPDITEKVEINPSQIESLLDYLQSL